MIKYPIKFSSVIKTPIWGSEDWLVSAISGNESIVINGEYAGRTLPQMVSEFKSLMVGERIYTTFGNKFPLLIKYIRANDDLSIQVHPNDDLAMERAGSMGKNEMWYILGASKEAKLLSGFNKEISKSEYLSRINNNTIVEVLNECNVAPKDVFYLPAGRVHAIGGGCFILEVQQSSDITYRIYDYDRRDANGDTRELHTELAVDAIDYSVVNNPCGRFGVETTPDLVRCEHFIVKEVVVNGAWDYDYSSLESFVILVCTQGVGKISWGDSGEVVEVKQYDSLFLPASLNRVKLEGQMQIIKIYI